MVSSIILYKQVYYDRYGWHCPWRIVFETNESFPLPHLKTSLNYDCELELEAIIDTQCKPSNYKIYTN